MSDTFITVIAIFLSALLIFVFPVVTMSKRVDNVTKNDIKTITSNFIDEIRTTGTLTQEQYESFRQNLTATGNTYNIEMEFKILDENPGKKTLQSTKDKIGENVYYSVYTSQIEQALENNHKYDLKQGDFVSVAVKNTNITVSQQLRNFFYAAVGKDTYTIDSNASGLVTGQNK